LQALVNTVLHLRRGPFGQINYSKLLKRNKKILGADN